MYFTVIWSFLTSKLGRWIIGILLGLGIVWLLYRWAKKQGMFVKHPDNGQGIPAGWSAIPFVERLNKAFSGWGTDEEEIFDVLENSGLTNDMKAAIYNDYLKLYKKTLLQEFKDELSDEDYNRALNNLQEILQ